MENNECVYSKMAQMLTVSPVCSALFRPMDVNTGSGLCQSAPQYKAGWQTRRLRSCHTDSKLSHTSHGGPLYSRKETSYRYYVHITSYQSVFTKGLRQGLSLNSILLYWRFKPKPWLSSFVNTSLDV